ncbi:MAG: ribonuclease J [Rhodospirillales bacterium]|jgi:ribonuclease J|nr:ribonuclease J [Rhodospirillales bacterium]
MNKGQNDELLFVPLGGAGEIGMNLNLYGLGRPGKEDWIMIDLGITFGDGTTPGVDVILPDPAFIAKRRDRLVGLLLTHAHEDHLGAVPYLWERLRCPIYATPFTAAVLRRKLSEVDLLRTTPITEVPLGGRFNVGPFDLELITLTHSIPEPNAVAIRTPLGTVLHTGDWKFDPDPVVGPTADEAALNHLGDDGVLALVGDSTNALVPGTTGSEGELLKTLTEIIKGGKARVAVACFASNVARLETIATAAAAGDRDVVVAGRSLKRFEAAARETGYLADVRPFIDEADAGTVPKDKMLVICTGSQGEPRAALSRIAAGNHPNIALETGDRIIFSSRVIPGNETSVSGLQNQLAQGGVEIFTWKDAPVHVSGHPARDELARMYTLTRPSVAVPVHGEARHLIEHARLARACQVPQTIFALNGTVVRLAPGEAAAIDTVPSGRLVLEGNRVVTANGEMIRGRVRALYNGTALITVAFNGKGGLAGKPQLTTIGLLDEGEEAIADDVISAVRTVVKKLGGTSDDEALREAVRLAVRRTFRMLLNKKPMTKVHLVRL